RRILFKLVDLERNLEVIRLVSRYKRGLYGLYDRLWSNAVLDVIGFLDLAAASRFIHRIPHLIRDLVGVEYRLALGVLSGTTHRLYKRSFAPRESCSVRIEDRNERNFRHVEALAQ